MSSRGPARPRTRPARLTAPSLAECERREERVAALHALVRQLPQPNYDMLTLVLQHLRK